MPLVRIVAVLLATLVFATPAMAQDNTATAVNDQDGSTQIDIAFDFKKVMNGVVDQTNVAEAYASCTECQTVAIAIQIVLVMGDVDMVAPHNVATAVNVECATCLTVAWAYQFVWGNGQVLRLTGEAQRQLAALAKAFRELEDSGRSAPEVLAETNRLLHELSNVLAAGIEPVGQPRDDDAAADRAAGEPADADARAQPTPSGGDGEPTSSAEGEPDAAPPAAESPTAEPSATPEPSATSEATPTATAAP